jgi:hypothetical protein
MIEAQIGTDKVKPKVAKRRGRPATQGPPATTFFGKWFESKVLPHGTYSAFVTAHGWGLHQLRDWLYSHPPHISTAARVAKAISEWSGEEITTVYVRAKIDPGYRRLPQSFGEWLNRSIEVHSTVSEFSRKFKFNNSTVQNWIFATPTMEEIVISMCEQLAPALSELNGSRISPCKILLIYQSFDIKKADPEAKKIGYTILVPESDTEVV